MRRLFLCVSALALAVPASAMAEDAVAEPAVELGTTEISKDDVVIGKLIWRTERSETSALTRVTTSAAVPAGRYFVRLRFSIRCDMPDGTIRNFSVSTARNVRSVRRRGLLLRRTRLAADCAGGKLNPYSPARISLRMSVLWVVDVTS